MLDLANKTHDELKVIAKQLGIKTRNDGAETLRAKIVAVMHPDALEQAAASGLEELKDALPVLPVKPDYTDPETLRAEVARLYPTFTLLTDESTWHIKNGAAEDSGTLYMPMDVIMRKAAMLKTARFPAKFKGTGTDLDGALA